jgi:plastocyanin
MKRPAVMLLVGFLATTAFVSYDCSKKSNPTAPPTAPAGTGKTVSIVDNSFSPATISVIQGDTVTWKNNGSIAHTSTSGSSCSGDGKWDSGNMAPSATYRHVFAAAGSYPYFCSYHCSMGMTGTVTVTAK